MQQMGLSDLALYVRGLERARRQNMYGSVMRYKGRGLTPNRPLVDAC